MKIIGIEGLTDEQIDREIQNGAKFVGEAFDSDDFHGAGKLTRARINAPRHVLPLGE